MLEPGSQLGRYEIQRRLGRGGMGTVYVAHDPVLGRMVAIKVFAGDLDFPDARERFSREARSAAALSHPNIVTVFDYGEFDSQPYIVMEYVPGETLAAVIRRKAEVATADKLRWIEELCAGAGYAHEKSVIHRDIKPANLMIDRSGRLKILDFGIARVMGAASNTTAMIGTPGYMAPEQIEGKPADHRADLFSIGVVFYELLAYTDAFPGETIPAITHRILTEDPVPLSHLVPEADPGVVALIERALKKNVSDRFEDAEKMRAAIARIRRQFELDVTAIRPADAPRRDVPPPRPGRGTGSVRIPSSAGAGAGVASLTPPPERISTDREAVARLRVAYLETALEAARALFEQNELTAALEACQQALAYDETDVRALDLAQRIEDALLEAERETSAAPLETRLPAAPDPGAADRTVLKPIARTPPPSEATVLRPSATPVVRPSAPPQMPAAEATIIAPPRRTPPPTTPMPMPAPPMAAPAVPAPSARRPAPPPVAKAPKPAGSDLQARLRAMSARISAALPALPALPPLPTLDIRQLDRRTALMWGGGAALAIAVLVVGLLTMVGGPAPAGTVILDAVPWATVSAVVSEDGEPQPLPSPASTPLALSLPAGDYEVVLVGPPPDSQEQRVSVHVDAETAVAVPLVRFRAVTPEEYFEPYLTAPAEPALAPEPVAPAPEASTPAPGVSQ